MPRPGQPVGTCYVTIGRNESNGTNGSARSKTGQLFRIRNLPEATAGVRYWKKTVERADGRPLLILLSAQRINYPDNQRTVVGRHMGQWTQFNTPEWMGRVEDYDLDGYCPVSVFPGGIVVIDLTPILPAYLPPPGDPVPDRVRYDVMRRDGWRCVRCGWKVGDEGDGQRLEVDHVRPRSRAGSNDVDNLQTLCRRCNSGKSNRYEE